MSQKNNPNGKPSPYHPTVFPTSTQPVPPSSLSVRSVASPYSLSSTAQGSSNGVVYTQNKSTKYKR
jgi:hypothetical protein